LSKQTASKRRLALQVVTSSPLRNADPRTKLALSLGLSLAVMLPLAQVAVALAIYAGLLLWAHLLPTAARQVWRLKIVLVIIFIVDWWLVSPDLAAIITLRIILLTGAFTLFFAATTPEELRLALEWLRVPYRYAFSLSLAFQSLGLLEEEWQAIREAQQARGAWNMQTRFLGRAIVTQVRDLVALTAPAIMMATRRAWAITEAAYARGFDSPHRRPYRRLAMKSLDWLLLLGAIVVLIGLALWRLQ
jgi:energy-coupling factor transporter transmembrane protein EcfT